MTAAKSKGEDVLLPQDAKAVDPSQLSALTPEVVSFLVWHHIRWLAHLWALALIIRREQCNGLWGHHMRLEGDVGD